jgi:hypothetical protein
MRVKEQYEPGSSGGIVPGYGLDDLAIQVWSLAEAKHFSSNLWVQTGSGAHPASCTMGTGCPFPRGMTLTTHPYLVPRSWMSRSYTFSPPCTSIGVLWDCFTKTATQTHLALPRLEVCHGWKFGPLHQLHNTGTLAKKSRCTNYIMREVTETMLRPNNMNKETAPICEVTNENMHVGK